MEYKKHEYNIFPVMLPEDYDRLLNDLKENGYDIKQPIYLYQNKIIDGWNRYRACQELEITPTFKEFIGTNLDAILFVMRTNKRRNLKSGQWAAIGVDAKEIVDAIKEQVEAERVRKISEKQTVSNSNSKVQSGRLIVASEKDNSKRTAAKVAETFNTNRTYVSEAAKLKLENPEVFEKIKSGVITITEAKREEKKQQQSKLFATLKEKENLPFNNNTKYDVVVIDPPWQMEKIQREVAPLQIGFDYPTMTIDEIKNFKLPASDKCHVFMWITQKHLPHGFDIFNDWGVKYVCCFVWHKNGGFQPFGLPQYNCEFILYGRIGSPVFFDLKDFSLCFDAPRTGHSKKPDKFYETIKRVTAGKRIDIFNRRKIDGYDTWGNQAI